MSEEQPSTPIRKPFDPAVRRLLDEQAAAAKAAGGPPPNLTNEQRVQMARGFMVRALQSRTSIEGLPNQVTTRETTVAPGLEARLYLPPGADADQRPRPVLVYLHGGGWTVASVAILDPFCRLLSEAADVIIASVEYRLAPEHPYPAALDDTLAAARWAAGHASEWSGDPSRLALGGDSAGANLAAVAANRLCAQGEAQAWRALMLLYPITDHPDAGHASYVENATGYGLDAALMRWFAQQYAAHVSPTDPHVWPLHWQTVPALPATLVATAEYDVLRDEGIAYAQKLEAAGVGVTHLHAPDMGHNFPATPNLVGRFPQSRRTLADIAAWLNASVTAGP